MVKNFTTGPTAWLSRLARRAGRLAGKLTQSTTGSTSSPSVILHNWARTHALRFHAVCVLCALESVELKANQEPEASWQVTIFSRGIPGLQAGLYASNQQADVVGPGVVGVTCGPETVLTTVKHMTQSTSRHSKFPRGRWTGGYDQR